MKTDEWQVVLEYPPGRWELAERFGIAIAELIRRDEFSGLEGIPIRIRRR